MKSQSLYKDRFANAHLSISLASTQLSQQCRVSSFTSPLHRMLASVISPAIISDYTQNKRTCSTPNFNLAANHFTTRHSTVSTSQFLLLEHSFKRRFNSQSRVSAIGFIGLGAMGRHMASNLAKHKQALYLFDANPEAVQSVLQEHNNSATVKSSQPHQLVEQCHTIITMLPSSPHVRQVYADSEAALFKLLQHSHNKPLLIDCSTIDPLTSQQLSNQAKHELNVTMLDAPVSGGINGARDATLTFMCGADEESDLNAAMRVLQLMGKKVIYTGKVGTGQIAKICNNLALAIEMAAVAESLHLGIRLGISPHVLSSIFNVSSAQCWSTSVYNPVPGVMENVPSSRNYEGGFQTKLMHKDLHLAIEAAKQIGVDLKLGQNADSLYQQIIDNGKGHLDFSYVYKLIEQQANNKSNN